MAHPLSDARIDEEVQKAIAKALRKPESAIGMDASIIEDLGGTSLDFLDITFRLEQAFGVRLPHNLLVDQIEELFGEGTAVDAAGRLTPAALEIVRLRLGLAAGGAGGDPQFSDEVPARVTPKAMAGGVKEILAHLAARCPACGAASWTAVAAKTRCGACSKDAVYPDGDALTQQWIRRVAREKNLFAPA